MGRLRYPSTRREQLITEAGSQAGQMRDLPGMGLAGWAGYRAVWWPIPANQVELAEHEGIARALALPRT